MQYLVNLTSVKVNFIINYFLNTYIIFLMFDKSKLNNYFDLLKKTIESSNLDNISLMFDRLHEHFDNSGRIFIAGNGGSAAIASHATTDLAKLEIENKKLNAISLNENIPLITALSNDEGYENYLVEIIKNYKVTSSDTLIVISSSGNSNNLINLMNFANEKGLKTFGLLGFDGGELAKITELPILFSSDKGYYGPIEDLHMMIFHLFAHIIKNDIKEIN